MTFTIKYLDEYRLPGYPNASLYLDRSPLAVVEAEDKSTNTNDGELNTTIGIATTLYNWCPDALAAFLDLDAWFSFTWSVAIQQGDQDETNIEIGRVGNQITFGTLDKDGDNWTLMLTYNIVLEGEDRGIWKPNPKESMQGEEDVTDMQEIDRLSRAFATSLVEKKVWLTGKKIRHTFHVEYAPMDVWGDGILMNPHWLYKSLDLSRCTSCSAPATETKELQRCGRCGTATYCSSTCQRKDWAVHKHICNLSLEDRGQMLAITEKGGLIGWDEERMYAKEGSGEESKNPNFLKEQLKRTRTTC
ncbi:hypothetical protein BDU57DRAFT_512679 [Ampelomyces quisqualis]|uniref:MYND-type domain-containing protein n=1 Tax=Ampelomyces quisqualis TaxID=50730 RepID=A0A6A5R0A2_AMPQU|nr:hypothetical protein BDU57DRAFT_512679 [Ampelomyces quisqualis]